MLAKLALASALALTALPAFAQRVPVPVMDEADIKTRIGADELEGRLNGDLNGDGEVDTVYVQRGEDSRKLSVMVAYRTEVDLGHDPVGELALDAYPLGPASMEIKKGVLVVEDLTGGTSAISSTYRYRFDPAKRRMRLIGLDAKFYSRTNAHGWNSVSWNLLTGDYVKERAELVDGSEGTSGPVQSQRSKRPLQVIYMEETPDPNSLVGPLSPRWDLNPGTRR